MGQPNQRTTVNINCFEIYLIEPSSVLNLADVLVAIVSFRDMKNIHCRFVGSATGKVHRSHKYNQIMVELSRDIFETYSLNMFS